MGKKVKKAEKSKVKLKTTLKHKTQFLPKGGNVTKTNFKLKPIVVQEQLKHKGIGELLTSRKLSFKDLLTRLKHHNVKVRCDGCEGLLELIKDVPQHVLEVHLHAVLLGISKLFSDKEYKVRRQAVRVINDLLRKVTTQKLTPFFEVLVLHTKHAMTDLDVGVQEDSLLLIDAYVRHVPKLIANWHMPLFFNLVQLISKMRGQSSTRILNTELGYSTTTTNWRIKVLHQFQALLKIVVKEQKAAVATSSIVPTSRYVPLYKGLLGSETFSMKEDKVQEDYVIVHIDTLLGLLNDVWSEVLPTKQDNFETTILDYDSSRVLNCCINVYYLLWIYVNKNRKTQKKQNFYHKNNRFFNNILTFFPYQQKLTSVPKAIEHDSDVKIEPKMVKENLLICLIYALLYKNLRHSACFEKADNVLDYINMVLSDSKQGKLVDTKCLLQIIKVILFENYGNWKKYNLSLDILLDNFIAFYKKQLGEKDHDEVVKLLTDMIFVDDLKNASKYKEWLKELPILLCQPRISCNVLHCISTVSRQMNNDFLEGFLQNFSVILSNANKITFEGQDFYPQHLKIANMFAFIPELTPTQMELVHVFLSECEDETVKRYFTNVFHGLKWK
ncbi:hypothetical protein FQA39_LY16877 [Lamprigera yunnana]|nr:hypothetical protein FQA39_LY16877 [Lamprigera yunnana]